MSRKYNTPRTPKAMPIKNVLLEVTYTNIQNKYGVQMMTDMMDRAKSLGLVKNPKAFRRWVVDEAIQFIVTLSSWLEKKVPELPEVKRGGRRVKGQTSK